VPDQAPLNRHRKLAIFKNIGESPFVCVSESMFDKIPGYVRLTEYVEVEFPPLQDHAVIAKHLEALDRAEAAVTKRYFETLADLKQQKEELRAITYNPDVVA
jgi:hypothetical protein